MKIKLIILFVIMLSSKRIFAQNDVNVYYMTTDGRLVKTKGEGDIFVKVYPSEPGGDAKLFVVEGYYNDGTKLFHAYSLTPKSPLKLQGPYIMYAKNGNKKSERNFDHGNLIGDQVLYYPNGKLYLKMSKGKDDVLLYKECRDSTGRVLTENGNGDWITYSDDFSRVTEQGRVLNGLKDSVWAMSENEDLSYQVKFKEGKALTYTMTDVNEKIFTSAEVMPRFPGGVVAFNRFLAENISYPAKARENHVQGRVLVTFVVERDGTLSNVHTQAGIGSGCDEEAVRVIKMCPHWQPGMQNGKPVRVQFNAPVSFTVDKYKKGY